MSFTVNHKKHTSHHIDHIQNIDRGAPKTMIQSSNKCLIPFQPTEILTGLFLSRGMDATSSIIRKQYQNTISKHTLCNPLLYSPSSHGIGWLVPMHRPCQSSCILALPQHACTAKGLPKIQSFFASCIILYDLSSLGKKAEKMLIDIIMLYGKVRVLSKLQSWTDKMDYIMYVL
jgi:hypothetical protein